jgi:hypothetical protein
MDTKLTFKYKKSSTRRPIILGGLWTVFAVVRAVLFQDVFLWFFWILLGFMFFCTGLYALYIPYITVDSGILTKNQILKSSIGVAEVQEVFSERGWVYLLKGKNSEVRIDMNRMDEESAKAFEAFLDTVQQTRDSALL